jgi:hypothetical protein
MEKILLTGIGGSLDCPEWIQFGEVVNGRCMRLKLSGEDLWRVATA